jgi:hypothetical protein
MSEAIVNMVEDLSAGGEERMASSIEVNGPDGADDPAVRGTCQP